MGCQRACTESSTAPTPVNTARCKCNDCLRRLHHSRLNSQMKSGCLRAPVKQCPGTTELRAIEPVILSRLRNAGDDLKLSGLGACAPGTGKPKFPEGRITMKPSELVKAIKCAFQANLVPFVWGESGIGKSSIVAEIAAEDSREVHDVRAVQLDPVDLRGLPVPDAVHNVTRWLTPEFLPTHGRSILFLDELPSAPPLVQAACYSLVLDRKLGSYSLPEGALVVAAGNPAKTKGVHFAMPYPLRARFSHLTLEADLNEFCQWAFAHDIDPLIIAYLRCKPEMLHQPPTQDVYAWPQPRSWAAASRLYQAARAQGTDSSPFFHEMLAGTIGNGAAAEFLQFVDMASRLPSPEAILLNPLTTPVPDGPDGRIAVAAALGRLMTPTNIANAVAYLKRIASDGRIDMEFTTLAIRDAVARDQRITLTREFTEFAIETQGALV